MAPSAATARKVFKLCPPGHPSGLQLPHRDLELLSGGEYRPLSDDHIPYLGFPKALYCL